MDLRHGSLLAPVRGVKAAVLASNPPYIAFSEIECLPRSVRDWEPPIALFSGHDGMAATTGIVRDAWRNLVPGGLLALEVDERRASLVAEMVMRHGAYANVSVALDLSGRERFVYCETQILRDTEMNRDTEMTGTQRKTQRRPAMLEEKARDLGRVIGQSPEYMAVKKSSEALNADRDAVTILQQMEKIRTDAQQMIQRGEEPTSEMEKQLDDLLTRVQSNPVYQRAISAQENFDKVMYQVNNWIMEGMKKGASSPIITLS